MNTPISTVVDEQIWTFSRNGEALEVTRAEAEDGFLLAVRGDGPPRTYFFADMTRLVQFQSDFEKFLLGTGWSFVGFAPDRRSGHERRHFSRLLTDRRRWWTDGLRSSAGREDGDRAHRLPRRRPR
jgi:hypothetical protein